MLIAPHRTLCWQVLACPNLSSPFLLRLWNHRCAVQVRTQRLWQVNRADQASSLAPNRVLPVRPVLAIDPLECLPSQGISAMEHGSMHARIRPRALHASLPAATLADMQDYAASARNRVGAKSPMGDGGAQQGGGQAAVCGSSVWHKPREPRADNRADRALGDGAAGPSAADNRQGERQGQGNGPERAPASRGLGEAGAGLPPPVRMLYALAVKMGVQPDAVRAAAERFARITTQHGLAMQHPLGGEREQAADGARWHAWHAAKYKPRPRKPAAQAQAAEPHEAGEAELEAGEIGEGQGEEGQGAVVQGEQEVEE